MSRPLTATSLEVPVDTCDPSLPKNSSEETRARLAELLQERNGLEDTLNQMMRENFPAAAVAEAFQEELIDVTYVQIGRNEFLALPGNTFFSWNIPE